MQNVDHGDFLPRAVDNQIPNQHSHVDYKVLPRDDVFKYHSLQNRVARSAWLIFSIILFPVGCARMAGYVINRIATSTVILPSLRLHTKQQLDGIREESLSEPNFAGKCTRYIVETTDAVKLDTMMVRNPIQANKPINEQKFIIFFNGNGTTYEENLPSLEAISKKTRTHVYSGNYRGVGYSEGFPTQFKDLVMDGEAMVQFLLKQGVHPKNILIHGWSLGGAVGAHVAALHQEKGRESSHGNDRSFKTMVKEVKYFLPKVLEREGLHPTKIKLLTFLAVSGIKILGWNFQSFKCYQKIKGHKFVIYHPLDEVIPYQASLHRKIEKINKKNKQPLHAIELKLNLAKKSISAESAHCLPIDYTDHFDEYHRQVALALNP